MRIFSIILADDEQQILYGMKKGIEWEKLGFRVAGVAQNLSLIHISEPTRRS